MWYRGFTEFTRLSRDHMPAIKTGRMFTCQFCGKEFYRRGSHILRGITKSCGAPLCKSAAMSGENNPFWGQGHSDEMKAKLAELKRAHPRKYGPAKGSFKHTDSAKAKMSASLKERWATRRDEMIAKLPRGETHHWRHTNHEPRYRSHFTAVQRREWIGTSCVWCDAPDDLVLDHIIPISGGGKNKKSNAQTLCRTCNLWKATYVDRPFLLASLDDQ